MPPHPVGGGHAPHRSVFGVVEHGGSVLGPTGPQPAGNGLEPPVGAPGAAAAVQRQHQQPPGHGNHPLARASSTADLRGRYI